VFGLENVQCIDALEFLRLQTRRYACILAIDVLEHLTLDYLLELGEQLKQCLEPTGTLIVRVPNALSPLSPLISGDLTHVRGFSRRSLVQFFTASGFDRITICEERLPRHDYRSFLRATLWSLAVRPMVASFAVLMHGPSSWTHPFTSNIVAVAGLSSQASMLEVCPVTDGSPGLLSIGDSC
jgi:hypothetical protein